ncbi:hypothetical protein GNP63_14265 [Aliivibrio fischeri]|nr:hypothetical protein [Aliivibrio fischeri]MUI62399.1 hypothetical protein [Aliivibrio fischeri]
MQIKNGNTLFLATLAYESK